MKHLNTILIILLILTSCVDENNNGIEGDWIGYERSFILGTDTLTENFHIILSIFDDSIRVINYEFISDGNRDSLSKLSYLVSENNLIFSPKSESQDTMAIDLLNDSSLILSTTNNKYKYSRLTKTESETQEIELVEKMFTISDSTQILDTIEFIDNNSFLIYNLYSPRISHLQKWRFRQYLGFNLLIIDDHELPVFFIKKTQDNDFEIKREPSSNIKWTLKEIEKYDKLKQYQLIGKWTGRSNVPNFDIHFEFDTDSVKMNDITGGEMIKTDYILNLNRDIIFIYNRINYSLMSYRINDIKQDSIFLTRMSPIKDSFILTRMN